MYGSAQPLDDGLIGPPLRVSPRRFGGRAQLCSALLLVNVEVAARRFLSQEALPCAPRAFVSGYFSFWCSPTPRAPHAERGHTLVRAWRNHGFAPSAAGDDEKGSAAGGATTPFGCPPRHRVRHLVARLLPRSRLQIPADGQRSQKQLTAATRASAPAASSGGTRLCGRRNCRTRRSTWRAKSAGKAAARARATGEWALIIKVLLAIELPPFERRAQRLSGGIAARAELGAAAICLDAQAVRKRDVPSKTDGYPRGLFFFFHRTYTFRESLFDEQCRPVHNRGLYVYEISRANCTLAHGEVAPCRWAHISWRVWPVRHAGVRRRVPCMALGASTCCTRAAAAAFGSAAAAAGRRPCACSSRACRCAAGAH